MNSNSTAGLFFQGTCIAIGLALGGYFVSQTLYNSKAAFNTADVKGLAERRVSADSATWSVSVNNSGKSREDIPKLYEQTEANQKAVVDVLKASGFSDEEIKVGILQYVNQQYRDENQQLVEETHDIYGTVSIETNKVDQIEPARGNVNKLILKGLNVSDDGPRYLFTGLNAVKPEMLKEATRNARIAASEFAENAGVKVGGIQSASQGSFSVTDVGMDYGDTRKIQKDVRVVTNITFYLTD